MFFLGVVVGLEAFFCSVSKRLTGIATFWFGSVFVLLFSCCLVFFSVQAIQECGAGHDEMWWFNVESDANGVGGQLRRRGEKR